MTDRADILPPLAFLTVAILFAASMTLLIAFARCYAQCRQRPYRSALDE